MYNMSWVITVIYNRYLYLGYDIVMTGMYWSDFLKPGIYCIYTVCILFRMRS